MRLSCLGSSSRGNCYLLIASDGVLVVECGIPMAEVKRALNWKIGNIVGCIVSHEHNDHAKYIADYTRLGIRVLALPEVFAAKGLSDDVFTRAIQPKHGYRLGSYRVYTLPVMHDVPCLGFVIEHAEMGKLLFVTDTMALPYRVTGLNHIMIEANYSDSLLDLSICEGLVPSSLRERLLGSHMELETTAAILEAHDLSNVNEVVLLHLSSSNSQSDLFGERIRQATAKPVYIARRGLSIDLSITPY